MTLIDENAFGLLVSDYAIEDAEYGAEPAEFVERVSQFRRTALAFASETPLGSEATILDLGHALYFEIGDGDQAADLMSWLRGLRQALVGREFEVVAVLTHGGRWVRAEGSSRPELQTLESGYTLVQASRPSEPLRRALYAETAAHGREGDDGWGPGTYVDTEAVEAMGRALKNAPTPLASAGATFYRIGR